MAIEDIISRLDVLDAIELSDFIQDKEYADGATLIFKESLEKRIKDISAKKSLYGYNIDYLVAFAMACRRAGVSDDDLKEFASNCRYAFDIAQEEFEKNIRTVVDDLTKEEYQGEWDI